MQIELLLVDSKACF